MNDYVNLSKALWHKDKEVYDFIMCTWRLSLSNKSVFMDDILFYELRILIRVL